MAIDFDKLMTDVKGNFETKKKTTKDFSDSRFIKVTRDENKNGSLILRFIPDQNGLGVVPVYKHWGKKSDGNGNTRFFIAECPTTIDEKCPYCEKYMNAWKIDDKATIESLKQGKRSEKFITNVVVVKDPGNPENNGRVMLFEYGWKISKLIEDIMNGDEEAEVDPVNIYHPMKGANLHIKQSPQGEYISYDGSKFLSPSAFVEDMDELQPFLDRTHDLNEFLDPKKFESYEELEKKLFKYENGYELESSSKQTKTESEQEPVAPATKKVAPKKPTKPAPKKAEPEIEDDDDDFFNDL